MLSIGPSTCRSSGGYSVESRRVYLTFKNSPERNSRGLLILLRRVLFQGSHLLQILLKALITCAYNPHNQLYRDHGSGRASKSRQNKRALLIVNHIIISHQHPKSILLRESVVCHQGHIYLAFNVPFHFFQESCKATAQ